MLLTNDAFVGTFDTPLRVDGVTPNDPAYLYACITILNSGIVIFYRR